MDSSFLTPLALLLLSTLIGVVIRQNSRQESKTDKLTESVARQDITLARLDGTLTSVVGRVDDLHTWKNLVQERESKDLRDTIDQMRRDQRASEP
jgi:hypothetical protein